METRALVVRKRKDTDAVHYLLRVDYLLLVLSISHGEPEIYIQRSMAVALLETRRV